jgi:HAD superfamily hydrolase (TIGR01509 family)
MPLPAAVIFDFDGVILDSESAEYESHRRMYERCGIDLTLAEWCNQVGIWSEQHNESWARQLSERTPAAPSPETYLSEKHRILMDILPREPMSGIRDLVARLSSGAVPIAVGSTSPANWVVPSLKAFGLLNSFAAIVTGDDVRKRKPAPDIYVEAATRLSVDPTRAVAIEDSAPGLVSAKAAGMKVVAIPHRLTRMHDLSAADLFVSHAGEVTLERLEQLFAPY